MSEEGQDVSYYFIKGYLDYQDAEYEMAIENFKIGGKKYDRYGRFIFKNIYLYFWNYAWKKWERLRT